MEVIFSTKSANVRVTPPTAARHARLNSTAHRADTENDPSMSSSSVVVSASAARGPLRNASSMLKRSSTVVRASSSSSQRTLIAGANTSTGRLIAGMLAKRFGGDGLTLTVRPGEFGLDATNYVPEDMPDDIFEQRFGAPAAEVKKCAIVDETNADALRSAMETADVVIIAHEGGPAAAAVAAEVQAARKAKRVVALSRVGINRRDERPFNEQNKPTQKRVQVGQLSLPIGGDVPGALGQLDAFARAEESLRAARSDCSFELSIVRSGQLRGNGPLLMADYSARLVDNMYDVKFQDLYVQRGDVSEGYTKRLNLAAFLSHVATDRIDDAPEDVEVLSVVCKTNMFGEQSITPPTDRERRKGYDMAKGKAPAAIASDAIDALLAQL
jgi:hypothetical protein